MKYQIKWKNKKLDKSDNYDLLCKAYALKYYALNNYQINHFDTSRFFV